VKNEHIESATNGKTSFEGADELTKRALRIDAFLVGATIDKLGKTKAIADADEAASLKKYGKSLDALTKFIPLWVKVAIAVALGLGLGTMIGWKRIVVTVGERIGKSHLTYAEGASADISDFRSARRTYSRPESPARWLLTVRACKAGHCETSCSRGN